jgi:hypothetical protein
MVDRFHPRWGEFYFFIGESEGRGRDEADGQNRQRLAYPLGLQHTTTKISRIGINLVLRCGETPATPIIEMRVIRFYLGSGYALGRHGYRPSL